MSSTTFNLGVGGLHPATTSPFSLGNFQLSQPNFNFSPMLALPPPMPAFHPPSISHQFTHLPAPLPNGNIFGVDSAATLSAPLLVPAVPAPSLPPTPESCILQTTADTVAAVGRQKIPSLPIVASAMGLGKTLSESAQKIELQLQGGIPPVQSVLCTAAGAATEIAISGVGNGVVIGGIVPYSEAVVAFPPLATTIPAVGAAIPAAVANVERVAQIAGQAVETSCHDHFANALLQATGGRP
jgi:hypothetical protein